MIKVRGVEVRVLGVKAPTSARPRLTVRGNAGDESRARSSYARALAGGASVLRITITEAGLSGFPSVGAAKILAQEILRRARASGDKPRKIEVRVSPAGLLKTFRQHIEGYLRHVQEGLGQGPYVTVDIIIELKEGIVLIERSNPPYGWALPGGFVDPGESLETAAAREAREETHLTLRRLRQFRTYSDPRRDPRFHTVSTVFIARGAGRPAAGDDAQGLKVIPYGDLRKLRFAFDHNRVINDYLKSRGRG